MKPLKSKYTRSPEDPFVHPYDKPYSKGKFVKIWIIGIALIVIIAIVLSIKVLNESERNNIKTQVQTQAQTQAQTQGVDSNETTEAENKSNEMDALFPTDTLERLMQALTSKALDGRYPGTEGNERTMTYLQSEMNRIGLKSPVFAKEYLMPFDMILPMKHSATQMRLIDGDKIVDFTFGEDFTEFVTRDFAVGNGSFEGEYKIIDDPIALYDFESLGNPEVVIYTEKALYGVSYDNLFNEILKSDHIPKVVLYESSQQNSGYFVLSPYSRFVASNDNTNGVLIYRISKEIVNLLKETPEGKLSFQTDVTIDNIETSNVVGMIDGSGDKGVVFSAHFDHLGNNHDGTYNPGALDNASGVTTLLALAEAIKETANPEMDYYFIAFNGEEEGMYGSGSFAAQKPLDPNNFKIINIDMVGSSSDVPLEIRATAIQSIALQEKALKMADSMQISTIKSDLGSSDHVPLENVGYETISLTEFDKRFYHTPSDTVENSMDFIEMQNVAYFIYRLAFER